MIPDATPPPSTSTDQMLIGSVDQWIANFGFISARGERYFTHRGETVDRQPLRPGELVTFTPAMTERGLRARHVRRCTATCLKCGVALTAPSCGACGWTLGT